MVTRRAIFFDRDGVLAIPTIQDGKTFAALSLDEFRLYPEAASAVRLAKDAGFLCIVVTNQPDVASGKTTLKVVEAMHALMRRDLLIDDVEVNYEPSGSDARRRKPNPGMLFDAAEKWEIALTNSFMIGDRAVDMLAARRAGCIAVFVDRRYTTDVQPDSFDYRTTDVADAVRWCMAQEGGISRNV